MLDGFSSIALAAGSLQHMLSDPVINEVTAVGGVVLLGLGVSILDIKEIRVLNLLPSLVVAGALAWLLL